MRYSLLAVATMASALTLAACDSKKEANTDATGAVATETSGQSATNQTAAGSR